MTERAAHTDAFETLRRRMVRTQLEVRGIGDRRVLDAMGKVPRHLFVPEAMQSHAYEDNPLPIGEGQTISQPFIVALMTEALALDRHDNVLEIGTGSGYQASILAELVGHVYCIELLPSLLSRAGDVLGRLGYTNLTMKQGDGTLGWPEYAPYDAIIVTAGAPQVPEPLVEQLAVAGRMVVPVGDDYSQRLLKLVKRPQGLEHHDLGGCRFVKLIGEWGWPGTLVMS